MPLAEANGIQMYYECHGSREALAGQRDTIISGSGNHAEAAPVLTEPVSDTCLVVIESLVYRYLWQMTGYVTELEVQVLQGVSELLGECGGKGRRR